MVNGTGSGGLGEGVAATAREGGGEATVRSGLHSRIDSATAMHHRELLVM